MPRHRTLLFIVSCNVSPEAPRDDEHKEGSMAVMSKRFFAAEYFSAAGVFAIILFTLASMIPTAQAQPAPNAKPRYSVVAVDPRTAVATVRDAVSGRMVQFVLSDKRLLNVLKVGLGVDFNRINGLTVQGLPARCCIPIKPHKPTGPPQIDCSVTPQLCSGGKPLPPREMMGTQGDLWDQFMDFCSDPESASQCVPGPM